MLGKILSNPTENVIYSIDPYDRRVELVFLNTCGFISSGREEMFQTIDKLLAHHKKICLIGCAVQYYEKLTGEKQEQAKRKNLSNNKRIATLSRNDLKNVSILELLKGFKSQLFTDFEWLDNPRALTNIDNKFEYLKIAEGCNNSCSFCIIPKIRGKQISLPIPKILEEVQNLLNQ
ncbi:MAG: hypothetical protein LBD11_00865 [Candidatus Peribacteria bacterium]|nr:hypothetical protein [Candidatus Peribacteria bacterium]